MSVPRKPRLYPQDHHVDDDQQRNTTCPGRHMMEEVIDVGEPVTAF